MLSRQEVEGLLEQARTNERIMRRLEAVEDLLLGNPGLAALSERLPARVAEVYELEAVSLALVADNQRLAQALAEAGLEAGGERWLLVRRAEARLLLGDLERPYLSNRLGRELTSFFFRGAGGLASVALVPLWARGELLGFLALGSGSARRYQPELETDFLRRLGRKAAAGLDAAVVAQQAHRLERREAAVEMAGAACHNLAQPLTTVNLLVEKLARSLDSQSEAGLCLQRLAGELERLDGMVHQISQVSEYATKPYAQGLKIIDLEAAGAGGRRQRKGTST
jgi:uncharacterized protein YigA (DUF484 family)